MELPSSEDLCRPFYNAFLFTRLQGVNFNKTHWGAPVQPLLLWKSNEYCTTCVFVCVCVCARARARVFVTLSIQHAMCMLYIVIFELACSTISFTFMRNKRHDFRKSYRMQNVCFDFLYKFCLKHFLF